MGRLLILVLFLLARAASASAQTETVAADQFLLNTGPCVLKSGSSSPEGAVTGNVCDLYVRTSDGTFWRKASGTGNTGWSEVGAIAVPLPVASGGTGATTLTTNGVLYGNGTSAVGVTSAPGANTVFAGNSSTPFFTTTPTVTSIVATSEIQSPLITASEWASGGDVEIDPAGDDVLPATAYEKNLGALNRKWLTLHAAELWVSNLVAAQTTATIGGRVMVAPTTVLAESHDTGATWLTVKTDVFDANDIVLLESNGQVEWIRIDGAGSSHALGWQYDSITRNLDGSGLNNWNAGDAVVSTGTTGDGYIDLYAVSGVLPGSTAGPTIVGNVRTGTTYSNIEPRWAIGNLNGLYGYATDIYGAAFGSPTGAWVKIDPTNGVRLGHNATTNVQVDASGNATFSGGITSTSGTIGGWTLGASSLTATNVGLYSGAANTARVEVGTGSNVSGLNSGNASGDVCMWAGDSHANRTSAEFRVTCGGAVTMTGATITGPNLTVGTGSSYAATDAIKFTRPNSLGFGQTGDIFGAYSLASSADHRLVIENTMVGNATSDGDARIDIVARGFDSPSTQGQVARVRIHSTNNLSSSVELMAGSSSNTVTFAGTTLLPTDSTVSLGGTSNQWLNVYADNYFAGTSQGVTDSCNGTVPLTVTDGLMTACTSTSDETTKDVAGEWRTGLDAIRALRPIRYTFKPGYGIPGELIGLSAQNVRAVIPEMVREDERGLLQIPYTLPLIAALVNAVQELSAEVDALKAGR